MDIKSLTIYCSSSSKLSKEFYKISDDIGYFLAKKSIKIIYGGAKLGMMGRVSRASFINGGKVIGIIPKFLSDKEKISFDTTKTIIVKNMSMRKKKLFDMGDAYLILPGGSGTIEEATEVISWKIIGLHNKEIIIFNHNNFWKPLLDMYENIKNNNFGNKNLQNICKHVSNFQEFKKIFP